MKRGRLAPSIFGDDSDSDDSCRERPCGILRVDNNRSLLSHDTEAAKITASCSHVEKEKSDTHEEDSLEAYMSTLNAATSTNAPHRQLPSKTECSSESSAEVLQSEKILETGEQREQSEDTPARDLILEPVDHSLKQYPQISHCGYVPLPRVDNFSPEEKATKLARMGALLANASDLAPIDTFQDLALVLPNQLLSSILASFEFPTPIQRVAIPASLFGRNIIGVARTGSGKTAAYAIPLLCHISAQSQGSSVSGKGPRAVVIVPTRELALQITGVISRLGKGLKTKVLCVVGGHAKYEQFKRLRDSGAEVVVCTPGRFIDMVKMKACSLSRCSFVVLDEADRMFDMGFGNQVDALLSQIRPDAQKLLFSATFPRNVAGLANTYVEAPIRINIGQAREGNDLSEGRNELKGANMTKKKVTDLIPMVNENVTETYVIVNDESERESWLLSHLDQLVSEGLVIIFCQTRGGAASLANVIRTTGRPAACVHGETDHADREGLLGMFRGGELSLLVTTDLSARGLDIANIKNVVNYGCAKSWEWHVHRVGRTGRAAEKGRAFTLISKQSKGDKTFVLEASYAFRRNQQQVPQPLQEIAALERNSRREFRYRARGLRGRRRYK